MAQVIDTSNPEQPVARSDIQVPADAQTYKPNYQIVVVQNFLDGQQTDTIEFVLDERFREHAIQSLLNRSVNFIGPSGVPDRDLASFIRIDLSSADPIYISAIMKAPLYRPDAVNKIIDTQFKELV